MPTFLSLTDALRCDKSLLRCHEAFGTIWRLPLGTSICCTQSGNNHQHQEIKQSANL